MWSSKRYLGREKWSDTKRGKTIQPADAKSRILATITKRDCHTRENNTTRNTGKHTTVAKFGKTCNRRQTRENISQIPSHDWLCFLCSWLAQMIGSRKVCFLWLVRVALKHLLSPEKAWKPKRTQSLIFLFQITSWERHKQERSPSLDTSFM